MSVELGLFRFRKRLTRCHLLQQFWRQRYTTQLRQHGGKFVAPDILQTELPYHAADVAFDARGTRMGYRIHQAEHIREKIDRPLQRLVEQLLLRCYQPISLNPVYQRLVELGLGHRFIQQAKNISALLIAWVATPRFAFRSA